MRFIVLATLISILVIGTTGAAICADNKAKVAILNESFPGTDDDLARSLQSALNEQFNAVLVTADELVSGLSSDPGGFNMVVFPNARYLPVSLKDPLLSYLKKGGDMIVIGGPAFSKIVTKSDGKWVENKAPADGKADPNVPILESLSPSYKTYSVNAAKLVPNKLYTEWAFDSEIKGPVEVISPIRRSRGLGIGVQHESRWIPLLQAVDETNGIRGTAAAIRINNNKNFPDSIWGYIGFSGEPYREAIVSGVTKMAARISSGVFLLNAGMDKFGYFMKDQASIGADVLWVGRLQQPMLKLRIISSIGPVVYEEDVRVRLDQKLASKAQVVRRFRKWNANYTGRYSARVDLFEGDKVIDTIYHDFVIANTPSEPKNLVTVKDGDFYLDGKKWYPLGVNYWPIYCSGMEPEDKWGEWLDPERYDPEVINNDLRVIKELGMNVVSIQYLKASYAPALVDFLERCRLNGLKVHIYIEGLHPLMSETKLPGIDLIKAARLNQSEAVFAYDVGWEVHVGTQDRRAQWDKEWQNWIIDRYGSIENAVKDWNYKPSEKDGVISGPTDEQLTKDGEWRVMVAAYRRFWDDFISRSYANVVKQIRAVDPVHLVGARSGYGGTGQPGIAAHFPFDLASGVKHLDYVSPEAWGLGGEWQGVQAGGFHTLYSRFVSRGKPVYWAEYGHNIWPPRDEDQLAVQKDFYSKFYRMLCESGANGGACWWWPGGYRVGEKSDFGLVNPDGTLRPAALLAKEAAKTLASENQRPQPNYWITIDRDLYTNGYAGVWTSARDEYVKALNAGSIPGLKTQGTGTTSANVPLIAVGNRPLKGSNPPKYLNAEFNSFEVATSKNLWIDIEKLKEKGVRTGEGKPFRVRVSVGNTGEAEWLALPVKQEGAVTLTAETSTGKTYRFPITANVPMFEDAAFDAIDIIPAVTEKMKVTIQMEAVGRTKFGPKLEFEVAP